MMWEKARDLVEAAGTKVLMNTAVTKIRHRDGKAISVVAETGGAETEYACSAVVSSMPFSALLQAMEPPAPAEVLAAADDLHYRDFLTVALVVPADAGFPDNWIYVHSPEVKLGRIQNFGSWSPYLVKEGRTCLGLEYFVFEGDDMWTMDDRDLVELGKAELHRLGLVDPDRVEAGYVVRMPKAYPHYDADYKANVETMRAWIAANAPNVYPVGRNGMHRYNNQDHSMYTAMLSVENMLGANHDTWSVNVEEEYHEVETKSANGGGGGAAGITSVGTPGTGRDAPILPKPIRR
jgi:protoporphyrinogen oxidase